MPEVDPRFAARLHELIEQRQASYRALAARVHYGKTHVHDLATGRKAPTADIAQRLDEALGAHGELVALATSHLGVPAVNGALDTEIEALELMRRVEASDVGDGTLSRL